MITSGYYGSLHPRPEKNVTTTQKGDMTLPFGWRGTPGEAPEQHKT
jgi:hypothetical protein